MLPPFASDFKALTGHAPLPWQSRLFCRLVAGEIPSAMSLPTGVGKTSVMAIWLVALAQNPDLPRRLAFVVDRRAVADQASELAESMADGMPDGLHSRLPGGVLRVSTLRGRRTDNREWIKDPAGAAVIVGTVDMIGSRLLCRGYGLNRHMRPVAAGLLGVDSWIVLDEAHLSAPFHRLLQGVARLQADDDLLSLPRPAMRFTAMSATLGGDADDAFELDGDDMAHPVIAQRMGASKRLRLLDGGSHAKDMAAEAVRLAHLNGGSRVVAYCGRLRSKDDFASAQEVFKLLQKLMGDFKANVMLLVGQRRVRERAAAMRRLGELGFLGGASGAARQPAVVVATSAGEVGVDMDADHMVCDVVPWERMLQRLGRVNRMGGAGRDAVVSVLPHKDMSNPQDAAKSALDREALLDCVAKRVDECAGQAQLVQTWIQTGQTSGAPLFASVAAHQAVESICTLPYAEKSASAWRELKGGRKAAKAAAVSLMRLLRDERRATHALLHYIAAHLDGDVSVSALRRLTERPEVASELAVASTPEPAHPALSGVHLDEWFANSLPSGVQPAHDMDVAPWLKGHRAASEPQPLSLVWRRFMPSEDDAGVFFDQAPPHLDEILDTDKNAALKWLKGLAHRPLGIDDLQVVAYGKSAAGWRPYRQGKLADVKWHSMLVLDRRLGGIEAGGLFDPKAGADAHPDACADMDGGPLEDADEGVAEIPFCVRLDDADAPGGWTLTGRFHCADAPDEEGDGRLCVLRRNRDSTEKALDYGSVTKRFETLIEHQGRVASEADRMGDALGLSAADRRMLWEAGRLHDEGKATAVWQRAMSAPDDAAYAKTKGPYRPRLLGGFRHEGLSARMMLGPGPLEDDPGRFALAKHLVASHHGRSRPFLDYRGDDSGSPQSVVAAQHAELGLGFVRLQEAWGHWGLAWWEALLRCADMSASAEGTTGTTVRSMPAAPAGRSNSLPAPGCRMAGGEITLAVDMGHPGEMLAALGFAELVAMLCGGAHLNFRWRWVRDPDASCAVVAESGDPLQAVLGFIGLTEDDGCRMVQCRPLALAGSDGASYSDFAPCAFPCDFDRRMPVAMQHDTNWPAMLIGRDDPAQCVAIDYWADARRRRTSFWAATGGASRWARFQKYAERCRLALAGCDANQDMALLFKRSVQDSSAASLQFHPRPTVDALGWSPNATKQVKRHEHRPLVDLLAAVAMGRMSPLDVMDASKKMRKLRFGFIGNAPQPLPLSMHRLAMSAAWHPFKRDDDSLRGERVAFDWAGAEMTVVGEGQSAERIVGWDWLSETDASQISNNGGTSS